MSSRARIAQRIVGRPETRTGQSLPASKQQADEVLGVASIGLDPLRRPARDLARRSHQALEPPAIERTRQPVAGRPSLIATGTGPSSEHQPDHGLALAAQPLETQFTRLHI
jgi:hypothetical protein